MRIWEIVVSGMAVWVLIAVILGLIVGRVLRATDDPPVHHLTKEF